MKQFILGIKAFIDGILWLRKHKGVLLMLTIPTLLSVAFVLLGFGFFWHFQESVFEWVLFTKPDGLLMLGLYYIIRGIVYLSVIALGFMSFILFANVISAPLYDWVSVQVEKDVRGEADELSFWQSLLLIGEELKKVLCILLISVAVFLIPGVNVLTPVVAAFFVGWDVYDYPLARRGFTFKQRFRFVTQNFFSVLGIGLWLIIPGVQLLLLPLAVPGATILCLQDLKQHGLATTASKNQV